jgi:hypothetical protein
MSLSRSTAEDLPQEATPAVEEAEQSSAPTAVGGPLAPAQHSNANLLKMQTLDSFSTASALRKQIVKALPPPLTGDPLFPGMLRMSKNPKNTHLFMAFETAAQRDTAAALMCGKLEWRHTPWTVAEVTERDLMLTHRGMQAPRPQQAPGAAAAGGQQQPAEAGEDRKRPREDGRPATDAAASGVASAPAGVNTWAAIPYLEQLRRKSHH